MVQFATLGYRAKLRDPEHAMHEVVARVDPPKIHFAVSGLRPRTGPYPTFGLRAHWIETTFDAFYDGDRSIVPLQPGLPIERAARHRETVTSR